jgi:3-dehydroquinate dehydratase/shikimate dehydrogenase
LVERGARVTISGRTPERTQQLARAVGAEYVSWEERTSVAADILVNTTPVGMHPNVDESPIDAAYLRARLVVFDTVYQPEETVLVKQAREAGATVVTGVEMFVRQAAAQVRHFTGHEAPDDLLRQTLVDWFASPRR